ncbi:uncharacterized protein DMAD_05090 [Drosophila madeirensis]
MSGDDK